MNIPTLMSGLVIMELAGEELSLLLQASGTTSAGRRCGYRISGAEYEGNVIAAGYEIDEGPYMYHEVDKWRLMDR